MNTRILLMVVCFFIWSLDGLAEDDLDIGQKYAEFSECRLLSGESIAPCRIGYRTFGTLNTHKTNAILVPTWYGGTSANHAYLASPELTEILGQDGGRN